MVETVVVLYCRNVNHKWLALKGKRFFNVHIISLQITIILLSRHKKRNC